MSHLAGFRGIEIEMAQKLWVMRDNGFVGGAPDYLRWERLKPEVQAEFCTYARMILGRELRGVDSARPRPPGGDKARGLGGEEPAGCVGVADGGKLAGGAGSLCGSGRVPLPSGEGEGARGERSDFVRGGGNEKGRALAGAAGAPHESREAGA